MSTLSHIFGRIGALMDGGRSYEPSHPKCCCLEPYNTVSNVAFGVLGVLGIIQYDGNDKLCMLYFWMAIACFCSSVHHASPRRLRRFTLVLDWIPIAVSLYLNVVYNTLPYMTLRTGFISLLALVFLFNDLVDVVPVPWGHVTWHLLAAIAVDAHYTEVANACVEL